MSQVAYTLELDVLDDVGAGFATTRDTGGIGSKPKVVVPKSDWVLAGRPTTVTVVMGDPEVKEDPKVKDVPRGWVPPKQRLDNSSERV